jgi:hypothetical protein
VAGEGAGHNTRGRVCSPEYFAAASGEDLGIYLPRSGSAQIAFPSAWREHIVNRSHATENGCAGKNAVDDDRPQRRSMHHDAEDNLRYWPTL